jgi:SAM-dependent methyltransferase
MPADSLACPVCESRRVSLFAHARDVEYYTSDKIFAYLQCGDCCSVFLESPPVDQLRAIYPPNYYSYRPTQGSDSFLERIKARLDSRLFEKLLAKIPGESLNVLDVGGGSGWLLTLIRTASNRVKQTHEVDLDEGARAAAEAVGHVFHSCRIEEFSTTEKFDLVLMLNLIEHVSDPRAVLSAMRNLLSPGGLILIKTPNADTLDCRIFRRHNWGGFHCPRHFVLFNRQSLIDLARRCGLEPVNVYYTQGAPQWGCSILGWLGLKGWIQISSERPLYTHKLYPIVCAFAAAFDLLRSSFMRTAQMFAVFRLNSDRARQ